MGRYRVDARLTCERLWLARTSPVIVDGWPCRRASMRTAVRSRGFDISYRVDGEGAPLLLLHGWSRWADDWWDAGYGDKLAADYRVITVDWIGHGESDKPHDPADYREAPVTADLVAVLDAEQADQTLAWGYSMGARHAATLAVLEPERVAALVCGSGAPLLPLEGRRERLLASAESVRADEQMEGLLRSLGADDGGSADAELDGELADGGAGLVGRDEVVDVSGREASLGRV